MKTSITPTSAPVWYIVDATGQSLGRIASKIAHTLRGKHKVNFSPHQLCGDHIIVINVEKMSFGPRQLLQKQYVFHSGYFGHIKSIPLNDMIKKNPEQVMEIAIKGMLPNNRLRNEMMKHLHVYKGDQHVHEAQKPVHISFPSK